MRDGGRCLQSHGLSEPPPVQFELDRGQQVPGLVLLDREIGIPGDAGTRGARSMVIDGKMLSRWAAMTCSTGTNRSWSGMTTKRDNRGGTLTLAMRSSPVTGSPPVPPG